CGPTILASFRHRGFSTPPRARPPRRGRCSSASSSTDCPMPSATRLDRSEAEPGSSLRAGTDQGRDVMSYRGRGLFDAGLSRRSLLRPPPGWAAAAGTGARIAPARADGEVLNLLSWPGHAGPEVVGAFEKQHGVKVQAKEYTAGEEMIALLQSSPPGTFDV